MTLHPDPDQSQNVVDSLYCSFFRGLYPLKKFTKISPKARRENALSHRVRKMEN